MELNNVRGINSLRALGVVLVVVYHYSTKSMTGGFIGVDIFFVISGYLATALFMREYERKRRIDVIAFFARRVRRLMPAAAFMVAVTLSAALAVPADLRVGARSQAAAVFGWVTNYYEIMAGGSYEERLLPHLFVHTWTLGVEMQYYIVWALLLAVMFASARRRSLALRSVRGSVVLACFIIGVVAYVHMQVLLYGADDPSTAYYTTTTRIYMLLVGSALGAAAGMRAPAHRPHPAVCALLIVFSSAALVYLARRLTFSDGATYLWGLPLVCALTVAILFAVLSLQPVGRFREIRIIAMIGRRSYSIYLFHWPMFIIVSALVGKLGAMASLEVPKGVTIALSLIVSLLFAEVSYQFFEHRPISAPERRGSPRPRRRGTSALAALCAAAVCMSVWSVWTAPTKTSIETEFERQNLLTTLSSFGQYDEYLSTLEPNPVLLHGRADALPPTPTQKAEYDEAVAAGLRPEAAVQTADPSGPIVAIQPPGGANVTCIGDSVMLGAADTIRSTIESCTVDAVVSRNMGVASDMITELSNNGQLGEYVVIALATNVQYNTVDATYAMIGTLPAGHKLILVTPYGKDYMEGMADTIRFIATQYDFIAVADWNLAIKQRLDTLAPDGMHMGGHDSSQIYANCIAQALTVAQGKPAKQ